MIGGKGEFKPIVYGDIYEIRQYGIDFFDYILDIGSNIGSFSILSGILHRSASVFSIEPSPENYKNLKNNINLHKNIKIKSYALADDESMPFKEDFNSLGRHLTKNEKGDIFIPTKTLRQIIDDCNIDLSKKICFKCDCEGGERFLLDQKSTNILKKFYHIGMEIHFVKSNGVPIYPGCLEYKNYRDWINENFTNTHKIKYKKSNKHKGYGHYILSRK